MNTISEKINAIPEPAKEKISQAYQNCYDELLKIEHSIFEHGLDKNVILPVDILRIQKLFKS